MPAEGALRDGIGAGFELIETMRWEPADGFVRIEGHMKRLGASAAALGFAFDRARIQHKLTETARGSAPLRARLTLARDGTLTVIAQPFAPLGTDTVWTVAIAETRLDSTDPLLRHKISRREPYEAARAEFSREAADEVILLNERGEVCEGTITSVFVDRGDGILLTPPLSSGLLAGVLRAELLETGNASEKLLRPDDLLDGNIYTGNSLRGLVAARIAT